MKNALFNLASIFFSEKVQRDDEQTGATLPMLRLRNHDCSAAGPGMLEQDNLRVPIL